MIRRPKRDRPEMSAKCQIIAIMVNQLAGHGNMWNDRRAGHRGRR